MKTKSLKIFYFDFRYDQRVSGFILRKKKQNQSFFNSRSYGASSFGISRYLTYEYLDIVWAPLPKTPHEPHEKQFFERLKLTIQFFFVITKYLRDNYFDIIYLGYHPPRNPQMNSPKSLFGKLN